MYQKRVEMVLAAALRKEGTFYTWGGDDPSSMDCSGLQVELCKIGGLLPRGKDYTAHDLCMKFAAHKTKVPVPGCLLYWGTPSKATHVEMVLSDIGRVLFTIGASGGGSHVKTIADAIEHNAFVKIREAKPNWFVAQNPFWSVQE